MELQLISRDFIAQMSKLALRVAGWVLVIKYSVFDLCKIQAFCFHLKGLMGIKREKSPGLVNLFDIYSLRSNNVFRSSCPSLE